MVKRNFEQDKSVSYSILTSRFVIPWEIEDYRTIHAEVETSDGRKNELVPEDDFEVDCEDNFITLTITDLEGILRIYDGEKQELKHSIDPNIRSPHNLLRYGDLSPIYLRLDNLEKYTDSIETGAKNISEVVSVLCQKVGQVDIIKMDRDVTVLASKSLEDMAEIAKLQESVKEIKSLKKEIESLEKKIRLLESRPSSQIDLVPLENQIKALEPLKNKFNSLGNLVFQATEENKYPGVYFRGQDGKSIGDISVLDNDLFVGKLPASGEVDHSIRLSSNKLILQGKTLKEHTQAEQEPRCRELENQIKALEPLKNKFNSNGSLVLRATEENKEPCIFYKGQNGKDIAQIFIRGSNLIIWMAPGGRLIS